MVVYSEYLWIVVLGGIGSFVLAFGIGANDVANNFGSAVGSKAVKVFVAIVLAAIFEFLGAVLFGSSVTDSIRTGVLDMDQFKERPDALMFGNLCVIIGTSIWLLLASWKGWPVSTTHSVIGALVGIGIATGEDAVQWRYVGTVLLSWIVSPLIAGICSGLTFVTLRWGMLRRKDPVKIGLRLLWLLLFLVNFVFILFFALKNPLVIQRSCTQKTSSGVEYKSPCPVSSWVAANMLLAVALVTAAAIVLTLILAPAAYWYARRLLKKHDNAQEAAESTEFAHVDGGSREYQSKSGGISKDTTCGSPMAGDNGVRFSVDMQATEAQDASVGDGVDAAAKEAAEPTRKLHNARRLLPWNHDLHGEALDKDEHLRDVYHEVEVFDARAECFFGFLQVISSIVSCIVHGANDVANATAPFASIVDIYRHGSISDKINCPIWILALCGLGISTGLAVLGTRVLATIGIKLTRITSSRGFSIDMGMGIVMVIGSILGIPLSTSHCKVGSTIVVGILDHAPTIVRSKWNCGIFNWKSINWRLMKGILFAWAVTLIFTGGLSAAIFAFAFYSPTGVSYYQYVPVDIAAKSEL